MLLSGPADEHSAGADTTLSPDALDLVTRAKAAVDGDPRCANKVSCADILALAARDVVSQVPLPIPSSKFQPLERKKELRWRCRPLRRFRRLGGRRASRSSELCFPGETVMPLWATRRGISEGPRLTHA